MFEVLDTAGQEEYAALRDQWIRDAEGFLMVYSIGSRSSFTRIRRFYDQVKRIKVDTSPPIMLIGHDYDEDSESGRVSPRNREVSIQEGSDLAKELLCDFVEASAASCINVDRAFFDVARMIRRQRVNQAELGIPVIQE